MSNKGCNREAHGGGGQQAGAYLGVRGAHGGGGQQAGAVRLRRPRRGILDVSVGVAPLFAMVLLGGVAP
eukprot:7850510-Pyramimonas_sp.AAC.1